jgi:hypothetical protein
VIGFFSVRSGSLPVFSVYSFIICVVAAVLYVAVNAYEPSRRVAAVLKILIVTLAVAAIVGHLTR